MPHRHPHHRKLVAGVILAALGLMIFFTTGPSAISTTATERTESQEREQVSAPATLSELPGEPTADATSLDAHTIAEAVPLRREAVAALATLSIRVKNGRKPLGGVTVQATEQDGAEGSSMRTDRRGRGRLNVTPESTVQLEFELRGVAQPIQQVVDAPGPGETKVVVIDASLHAEELSVTFQVLSCPSGTPLANTKVTGKPAKASARTLSFTRSTDADGLVTLPWLPEGHYTAEGPRHGLHRVAAPKTGGAEPTVIQLPEDAMLFGQITMPVEPLSGPLKLAFSARRSSTPRRSISPPVSQEELVPIFLSDVPAQQTADWHRIPRGEGWMRIDRLGNWQIAHIRFDSVHPLKKVVLQAQIEGHWRTLGADLTISPGDRQEVIDASKGGFDVSLQLHYDRGYSWSRSLKFKLHGKSLDGGPMHIEAQCNDSGLLLVPKLPVGTWKLYLVNSSTTLLAQFEHSGAPNMDVTLTGWVPLRGTVESALTDGPVPPIAVMLERAKRVEVAMTDDDHHFDLSPVQMDREYVINVDPDPQGVVGPISGTMRVVSTDGDWLKHDKLDASTSTTHFVTGQDLVLQRPR